MKLPSEGDLLVAINMLGKALPKRPVGKGWYTVTQLAKREGISITAMRQRFTVAIERGMKVERFTGSDYDPTGRLVKQTWFRVKR